MTSSMGLPSSDGSVTSAICTPVALLQLAAVSFQLRARLRIDHVREVADVALRLERFEVEARIADAARAHRTSAARVEFARRWRLAVEFLAS